MLSDSSSDDSRLWPNTADIDVADFARLEDEECVNCSRVLIAPTPGICQEERREWGAAKQRSLRILHARWRIRAESGDCVRCASGLSQPQAEAALVAQAQ